jgi:Tol biopolymer transport system component
LSALVPGSRLGPYEIISALGAGGMGEVYRARDSRLNRDVAIKVLLPVVANDPDRLARFAREAQVLASLNHPNIAHIHGVEEADGATALVLELVEGEDLAQRIARGPLPVEDALPIARQIGEALEAAHEQGIVHRDLKPANIKVRPDGTVKVLDFGLAKAIDPAGASGANAMNSPTLSLHATQAGIVLGTAAYMSPEQARGRTVDRRADIWAFGAVFFEMLTGGRAFQGDDVTDTIVSVVSKEPDWSALPPEVSPDVRRLLQRCLKKDPKARMRDIGEARLALDEAASGTAVSGIAAAIPAGVASPARARRTNWILAALSLVLAGGLVATLIAWGPWRSSPVPSPRKLLVNIGAEASLPTGTGPAAILSPDGTTMAFVASQAGTARLFIRKLDQLQATPLAGTEGALNPFFSPDGRWIAFFTVGKLKKVATSGGAALILCDAATGRGGTWLDENTIVFSPSSNRGVSLMRVPAAGGAPATFGTLSPGATTQRWPQVLPGGAGVLATENATTTAQDSANLVVIPREGGTPKIVLRGAYFGRYLPSGHLVYVQQGSIFGVRFDLGRLETVGQSVSVLEGVASSTTTGGAQLSFSGDGTLIYAPGLVAGTAARSIDWLTRDGKVSSLRAAPALWGNLRFSPDGQKVAFDISDGKQRDVWVYEWARDTLTQLTFDASNEAVPVWTPDGRRIAFGSDRAKPGTQNLYWIKADGTGEVTRLTESPEPQIPYSWHPNGRFLAFHQFTSGPSSWDLMMLPMEEHAGPGWTPEKPTVFLGTPAIEVLPAFSPDGRWLAYQSNESGGFEVYVRPFPGPGGKWRMSTEGGEDPRWSAKASELLFINQTQVLVAPYTVTGDSFRAGKPLPWSPTGNVEAGAFDIHPDGRRLGSGAAAAQPGGAKDHVVVVLNFFDYVRKLLPLTGTQ